MFLRYFNLDSDSANIDEKQLKEETRKDLKELEELINK